ncbi:DUF262 domain-containing protein [Bacillus cereus]|uniref:DUF262 domain-containing protein n=1 Tax=Bacillus cereus TaxID=1396 RepID=UPI003D0230DE
MKIISKINNTTQDVKWIVDRFKNDTLTVNNNYQRRFVWGDIDKIKLIETMLLGYSIPEIYLHKKETDPNTGNSIYEIVDGQQRITSISSYINDEFDLSAREIDARFRNKKFSELENEEKSDIWKYSFSVRIIDESVSEDDIRQLFLRLNATDKSLNPQELRNATFDGKFLETADRISLNEFWNLIYTDKNSIRRMQDLRFISEILVYFRFGIVASSQENINKAYDLFNKVYEEQEKDFERFEELMQMLEELRNRSSLFAEAMQRNAHLYSMFVIGDFILDSDAPKEKLMTRLLAFFEDYQNNVSDDLIDEYRKNSQDATGSKTRRIKRNNVLKKYILEG